MISKERFTAQMHQQIKVYNHLLQGLEVLKGVADRFNGKVLNVRFVNAMKESNNHYRLSYSLNGSVTIGDYQNRWYSMPGDQHGGYIDYYTISVTPVTNEANRIDAPKTIERANNQTDYLKKQIAECKADIARFDEEAGAWKDLERRVNEYNAKYSYRLRGSIDMRR
ncbi:MAG: hypothetical protein LUH22_10465 [Bacteroides sp.]|nr:hypothetical protein [Bacteroides sp.]